jgi:hypothetical protein
MKKSIVLPGVILLMIATSCGPAAEDREAMHIRAKSFQDSIAFIIRSSMAEAAAPGPVQQAAVIDTSKKAITSGAPAPNK